MANIRHIAKLTGYSVSTFSRVINGHPYVDEEKRKEILAVMKEGDYIPNA
ncbi:LacI family DNA-binding transcriptional regulator, partial [Enterococcus faecium]